MVRRKLWTIVKISLFLFLFFFFLVLFFFLLFFSLFFPLLLRKFQKLLLHRQWSMFARTIALITKVILLIINVNILLSNSFSLKLFRHEVNFTLRIRSHPLHIISPIFIRIQPIPTKIKSHSLHLIRHRTIPKICGYIFGIRLHRLVEIILWFIVIIKPIGERIRSWIIVLRLLRTIPNITHITHTTQPNNPTPSPHPA